MKAIEFRMIPIQTWNVPLTEQQNYGKKTKIMHIKTYPCSNVKNKMIKTQKSVINKKEFFYNVRRNDGNCGNLVAAGFSLRRKRMHKLPLNYHN